MRSREGDVAGKDGYGIGVPAGRQLSAMVPGPSRPGARSFFKRLLVLILLLFVLVVGGAIGFMALDGQTLWTGVLQTLDVVTTIGSIPQPQSIGGKLLWLFLVAAGVGTMFYALITVVEFVVAGHLSYLLGQRRMERMIESLSNHYLVCGFGRVGKQVARDLERAGVPFVVIDDNPEVAPDAEELDVPFVMGRASDDVVLERAGIHRAKGVLACVDSDAHNIFITLTARGLSEEIAIVARASEEYSIKKLKRAGANRVVSPYTVSAQEMAKLALRPQVGEYRDFAASMGPGLHLEEIELVGPCRGLGSTVGDINRRVTQGMVVATRKSGGEYIVRPSPNTVLAQGDTLVAIGTDVDLEAIERFFVPEREDALSRHPLERVRRKQE